MQCKHAVRLAAYLLSAAISTTISRAQQVPSAAPYAVVERGANYRVWQKTTNENGTNRVHSYTELATGMYYTNSSGQWVESKEEIETFPGGAIARQGQYQVIFANNLNSTGAIDQQTPDGKRLRSNILGLAYYDSSSGKNVLIAQIQDSQRELISSNQVLYPDAFDGVVKADVRYTYKRGSFEQDVILRTQPPAPESLGLNSQSTEIEVLTEFIDPPQASVVENSVKTNSLPDEEIGWGVARIGHGRAFDLGEPRNSHSRVTVRRQYITAQGRNILVEGVPLRSIEPFLAKLPLQASSGSKLPVLASQTLTLPKPLSARSTAKPMKLASASSSNRGFVLDYVELDADTNDITFQGGTTYYIGGNVTISGTATLEAGTVVKFSETNGYSINLSGSVVCDTSPANMAVFTSENDNSVGETLPWGSGSPTDQGNNFLEDGNSYELDHCRFCYAGTAVSTGNGTYNDLQLFQCYYGIVGGNSVIVNNMLASGCQYVFDCCPTCDNCTFDQCAGVCSGSGEYTNCIFSSITSLGYVWFPPPDYSFDGSNNGFDNPDQAFGGNALAGSGYQTGPLGNYYLPSDSPFIDAGSTTADQVGLYHFTTQTNQTVEGFSIVDLGYHYVAAGTNGNPLDSNGDGIPDYLEDANGNGLWDNGETNWALAILVQPTNLLANTGTSPAMSLTAGGVAPITYQWYFNSVALNSQTNATLAFGNVQTNSGGSYFVIVTNNYGSLTSSVATLTVVPPPTVTITNPANNAVFATNLANITLQAAAGDAVTNISQVEFFEGTTSLGIVTNAPYALIWSNTAAGNYALTAVATDNGLAATSPVVNIAITPVFATNTMTLWLKADALGLTNNAPVSAWPDSSGWHNNMGQPNNYNWPSNVINAINGYPVVHFVPTPNGFASPEFLATSNGFMNSATGIEAIMVLRVTVDPPTTAEDCWDDDPNNNPFSGNANEKYPDVDGSISQEFGTYANYYLGVPAQLLTQYHIFEVASQSNNWSAWINGVLLYYSSANTFGLEYEFFLGSDHSQTPFSGDIAEVLIFNRGLTPNERAVVNAYLNGKYGLVPFIPAAPSNLVATAISSNQISLTWSEPLDGGATQISIERSTNSSSAFAVVAQVADALSYVDTNLTAGTTYYYQARAINVNTWSSYSNQTNATTLTSAASIPFGNLVLWVKADSGLAQIGTNTPVSSWTDQSGNGNNVIQTSDNIVARRSGTYRPTWVSGTIGGFPVVHYTATNADYLFTYNPINGVSGVTNVEAFAVVRATTDSPTSPHGLWYYGGAGPLYEAYPATNGVISDGFGSTAIHTFTPTVTLTNYHVYEVASQSNNWSAWINGVLQTNNSNSFNLGSMVGIGDTGGVLGYGAPSGNPFDGDVVEVMIFNKGLTAAQRATVITNYLFAKYGISH